MEKRVCLAGASWYVILEVSEVLVVFRMNNEFAPCTSWLPRPASVNGLANQYAISPPWPRAIHRSWANLVCAGSGLMRN
jgi:hypothetical protein